MDKKIFETEEYNNLLRKIGVLNTNHCAYKAKECKHNQIKDYIEQLYVTTKKLSGKRQLVLVDCACGKCYISFAANYVLCEVLGMNVKFICIDHNDTLIRTCSKTAEKLGFQNMEFITSDLSEVSLHGRQDIVYCLHACDMATDMTIAIGIKSRAHYIFSVSCCQHSVKDHMKHHPLGAVTRYGAYKERLADMISDAMRSLIMESHGYKIKLFEFTGKSNTPKNIMVRAEKIGSLNEDKKISCENEYIKLKEMFHAEPGLHKYLGM